MKEIDYDKVIEVITKIGYKHRTNSYYVIREKDGYINISRNDFRFGVNQPDDYISFHKNHYQYIRDEQGFYKKDISHKFYTLGEFFDFINDYHKDLFLKHKINKLLYGIRNTK